MRTINRDGQVWFVAKDVCDVLELNNVSMAISDLDKEDIDNIKIYDTIGRRQQMTIISEPGMYQLVMRSTKPESKKFRKWVTGEVLPSIRKTGSYSIGQSLPFYKFFIRASYLHDSNRNRKNRGFV